MKRLRYGPFRFNIEDSERTAKTKCSQPRATQISKGEAFLKRPTVRKNKFTFYCRFSRVLGIRSCQLFLSDDDRLGEWLKDRISECGAELKEKIIPLIDQTIRKYL